MSEKGQSGPVDRLLGVVPFDAVLRQIDVQAILERIDVNALLDELDVDRLVRRIDVTQILHQVDIGAIVAESTKGVAGARWTPSASLPPGSIARSRDGWTEHCGVIQPEAARTPPRPTRWGAPPVR